MKKLLVFSAAWSVAVCASAAAPSVETPAVSNTDAVQVMVIGSFHMGNPGQDVANAEIENMLTAKRQVEIAAVSNALKAFKPNVVAVERITDAPDYVDPKFTAFKPSMLTENADERYQIGYRLANVAGVTRVYGIDEQPSEGEPDYFPFDELMAHAEATGQSDALTQQITEIQGEMADFGVMQKDNTVAGLLIALNDPDSKLSSPEFYYRTFEFDRGEVQPGAELQAYWFMRNAKIFSKLMQVTKPGDRVVVVYGGGHKFWLEHFVDHTPGFVRVDSVPYLEKADK